MTGTAYLGLFDNDHDEQSPGTFTHYRYEILFCMFDYCNLLCNYRIVRKNDFEPKIIEYALFIWWCCSLFYIDKVLFSFINGLYPDFGALEYRSFASLGLL